MIAYGYGHGVNGFALGESGPSVALTASGENGATSTYTEIALSGLSIGAAAANRIVVAVISWWGGDWDTVTFEIGGGAVDGYNLHKNGAGAIGQIIGWRALASGATADVTLSGFAANPADYAYSIYRVTAASSTPEDTTDAEGANPTDTLAVTSGAAVILGGAVANGTQMVATNDATGTEDYALDFRSGEWHGTASFIAASATPTIGFNPGVGTCYLGAVAFS